MLNGHAEVLILLIFAVVLGGVVFGGTTLVYFLDKHREHSPRSARTGRANRTTNTDEHPAAGTGHSSAELLDHVSSLRTAASSNTPWLNLHPPLPQLPEPQASSHVGYDPRRTER